MAKSRSNVGWIMVLAGLLLLLIVGNLGLAAVLIPVAAVLAFGAVVLLNHRDSHVTGSLK